VIRAEWLDASNKWRLTVRGPDGKEFEDECDVFINAGGKITVPNVYISSC